MLPERVEILKEPCLMLILIRSRAKENHSYRRKLIEGMFIERNKDKLVNINAGKHLLEVIARFSSGTSPRLLPVFD